MTSTQTRTNEEWVDALRGRLGAAEQRRACDDLASYLYIVAYNNLQKRRSHLPKLQGLDESEQMCLAEDFVQAFMEKMVKEQFRLLSKFGGHGRFASWAAQVLVNLVASEMRKAKWRRQEFINARAQVVDTAMIPETVALRQQINEALERCLKRLPERSRIALVRCVIEGDCAPDVAAELGVSANAVHILVHRAKKSMRNYLKSEGIEPGTLNAFGQ